MSVSHALRPGTTADAIDDVVPQRVALPESAEELAQILADAARDRQATVLRGGGSKLEWGRVPDRVDLVIGTEKLDRLLAHRHGDMTVTAQAGVSLALLNRRLAEHRQYLPVESAFTRATIGGIVAANDAGPMRHRFGTPRDLLIGVTLAMTDGRLVKAGGTVVKNVAGYDLGKLVSGSHGTLAVIVDATFKLLPIPLASMTLVATYADGNALAHDVAVLHGSQVELSAFDVSVSGEGRWVLLMRMASSPAATEAQAAEARRLLTSPPSTVSGDEERELWAEQIRTPWSEGGTVLRFSWLPSLKPKEPPVEWREAVLPGTELLSTSTNPELKEDCRALRLLGWGEKGIGPALDRLPRLERLDLGGHSAPSPGLTEDDLRRIGAQASLRELRLAARSEIAPPWLASLAGLPSLTTLALPLVEIGDEGAAALARCPSLQSLELAFDGTLTDVGLASLATLPDLRQLSVRGCGRLTSSGIRQLAACARLEQLDLQCCAGIGGGARRAGGRGGSPSPRLLEQMLTAELVLAVKPGGGVDDAALKALAALPGLRELLLTGCASVTPKGIAAIGNLPLRHLAISIRSADGADFVAALPPTIADLSLAWSTGLEDDAAALLGKQVPQLRRLDLFQCTALTDAALTKVLADTALVELELRGCRLLTASALPALLAARSLEVLDVSGHGWLDDDVDAKLKAMPKMRELRNQRRQGGLGGVLGPNRPK